MSHQLLPAGLWARDIDSELKNIIGKRFQMEHGNATMSAMGRDKFKY